jgi:glycosyltransferase involved in cell wall biosynthesis
MPSGRRPAAALHGERRAGPGRGPVEEAAVEQPARADTARPKVVVVMPAYNAGRTLRMTYEELPKDTVSLVILVDDGSTDATLEIARQLNLEIFVHDRNYGYGANQKTCYTEALRAGADIVVMVHPDYQYDPRLVPQIVAPIVQGEADLVLGSRLKSGGSAIQQGMPWWKYVANRFLTSVENRAFGLRLSEFHTGYRAFNREVLETVNFRMNSDGFVFDQEIIAQAVAAPFRIAEIAVPVRYFPEASSASFSDSCVYGLKILWVVTRYLLHRSGIKRSKRLQALRGRYTRVPSAVDGPPAG